MRTHIVIGSLLMLSVAFDGCESSATKSDDAVLSEGLVSDIKIKTLIDHKEYSAHPENNVVVTNTFDYEGDVLKQINFTQDNDVSGYITIERDNVGNIIKTQTFFNKDGGPENPTYREYIHTKGHLVEIKNYYFYEGNFVMVNDHKYEYNDKGQLVKMEVFTGTGDLQNTVTYEFTDDSNNPSVLHQDLVRPEAGKDYTHSYEYEATPSPMVEYLYVSGYPESALVKKNVHKLTKLTADSDTPEVVVYEYTYNENNLPVKLNWATPTYKQGWEFIY